MSNQKKFMRSSEFPENLFKLQKLLEFFKKQKKIFRVSRIFRKFIWTSESLQIFLDDVRNLKKNLPVLRENLNFQKILKKKFSRLQNLSEAVRKFRRRCPFCSSTLGAKLKTSSHVFTRHDDAPKINQVYVCVCLASRGFDYEMFCEEARETDRKKGTKGMDKEAVRASKVTEFKRFPGILERMRKDFFSDLQKAVIREDSDFISYFFPIFL